MRQKMDFGHSRLESFESQIEDSAPVFTLILKVAAVAFLVIGFWKLGEALMEIIK